MNNWEHDFNLIAQDLVDHSTPEQVREFERRGLHKTIGENIWKHAKETSRERIERREQEQEQGYGRSRISWIITSSFGNYSDYRYV